MRLLKHISTLAPGLGVALLALAAPAWAATGAATGVRLAPATPGGVRFTVTVPAPRLVRIEAEAGVDRLDLDGYQASGLPGSPAVPVRTLLVAVPPVGEVRLTAVASEITPSEGITLSANLGIDEERKPAAVQRLPEAYGLAGSPVPVAARLLGTLKKPLRYRRLTSLRFTFISSLLNRRLAASNVSESGV